MIKDPQSDLINNTLSYSTRVLQDSVETRQSELRDLYNSKLSVFYPAITDVSTDVLATKEETSAEFRQENELPTVEASLFADQYTGTSGQKMFVNVVTSCGIDAENVDDLVEDTAVVIIPQNGDTFSFVWGQQALGEDVTNPNILPTLLQDTEISDKLFSSFKTKHLVESDSYPVADNDPVIFTQLNKALDYVRTLLR